MRRLLGPAALLLLLGGGAALAADQNPSIQAKKRKGEDAFEKVEKREAYFTLATLPILSYYQYRHGLKNLKVAGYLDMSYDLSIAVNKSNYLLYNIIEKTLSTIPKSTVDIINDRWTTFKVIKTVDYIFILKIVAVLLLIIVIILIAYFKLKKLHTHIDMLNRTLEYGYK